MPRRDYPPLGAPCWVDLMTSDAAKSQTFYSALFGWTIDDPGPDFGGYFNFQLGGESVAGGMNNPGAGMPDVWSVYLATDDAKRVTADAITHGGSVIVDAMDVATL